MALLGFQRALGQMVLVEALSNFPASPFLQSEECPGLTGEEVQHLLRLRPSRGLHLTAQIQRSWCKGRVAKGAILTLSTLFPAQRDQLVNEWINTGKGTGSFVTADAIELLNFIAGRLEDPSHALTICRFEQAVLRASLGTLVFDTPALAIPRSHKVFLRAGQYASLVNFHAEPSELLDAVANGKPLPKFQNSPCAVLFGPGIPQLFRFADPDDIALWRMFEERPIALKWLKLTRAREAIEQLLNEGVIELLGEI